MGSYRTLIVKSDGLNNFTRTQEMISSEDLASSDVLIEVKYTALSYYDALVMCGHVDGVRYPMVPGIDAAGTIVDANVEGFNYGDEVIITGYDLGNSVPGGFGRYVSVPAEWVVPIPMGLTMRDAISLGTSGLVSGLGAMELINTGILPHKHSVAVTGAAFDTGAVATAILSHLGYDVTAYVSDVGETSDYVKKLGARKIKGYSSFEDSYTKSLMPTAYDGIIDTVGGSVLASIIKSANTNGTVVMASYSEDMSLKLTMHPFLSRGINLSGINGISCQPKIKNTVWQKLASEWKIPQLDWLCSEISLDEVEGYILPTLDKRIKGRLIINHTL